MKLDAARIQKAESAVPTATAIAEVTCSQRGKWDIDGPGNPADVVNMSWCWVLAVDAQGRAYIMNGASKTGYWQLYNKKEVTK